VEQKVGDLLKEGDVVCALETDKVVVDVHCPRDGTLASILPQPNQIVQVGEDLFSISYATVTSASTVITIPETLQSSQTQQSSQAQQSSQTEHPLNSQVSSQSHSETHTSAPLPSFITIRQGTRSLVWWRIGCLSAGLAVLFGAFGAHQLKEKVKDERLMKAYETGAQYHLLHSLGLILCSFAARPYSHVAGTLFLSGITLFSGSLYAMAYLNDRQYGVITPVGGASFIAGWVVLVLTKIPK